MRRDVAALREALARHGLVPRPAARAEEPPPPAGAAPAAAAAGPLAARAAEEARLGLATPHRAPAGTQASPPQAMPPRM
eukprot:12923497-Alexandrium_andersonii.AAC.1